MLNDIQKIRLEIGDIDPALPILADIEYEYFLQKNDNSIRRACLDAAKTILFKLSMRVREDVDIFSIYGQQAAQNYIMALKMFIKNPDLNPVLNSAVPYAGGISKSDMLVNNSNSDNNFIQSPSKDRKGFPSNYFEV